MAVEARSQLPGGLFLVGVEVVIVSTFLPWRQATPPPAEREEAAASR